MRELLLGILGLSGGVVVAAGVFALITMIGIVPRVIAKTSTSGRIFLYESMIIAGGVFGNWLGIFEITLPVGVLGLLLYGVFSGVFVGCLSIALAEGLKVIPIALKRLKMEEGVSWLIMADAAGKMVGVWLQFLVFAS